MNEAYVEQLVKRKPPVGPSIAKVILIGLTIASAIATVLLSYFAFFLALLFGVLAYLAYLGADIEYEYLFVNKELSIDTIYAKSLRKTVATFEINHVECLAPQGSHHLDEFMNRKAKSKDYSSHLTDSNPLVMVYGTQKDLQFITLEGSEELIKCFSMVIPRKVFKD